MINLEKTNRFIDLRGDLETKLFYIGILFLASAPFFSCLLFLYPLFKGLLNSKKKIFKDKINQVLILISFILLFISLNSTFFNKNSIYPWTSNLNWVGIVNFIPLFICFIGFSSYLDNVKKRKTVSKFFIAGTIPLLISCIGQFWLGWYGPFEILNGLIIWFQRPLTLNNQNVTGLFSNPNYAGAWLTMVWPFSIVLLKENLREKEYIKSKLMFLIIILITVFILLTNSRNAWFGLGIIIPFVFGKKSLKWYIPFISLLILLVISSFLTFIPDEIRDFSQELVPSHVRNKISEVTINLDAFPRLSIWRNAINFILDKPLFGWGGNSFPYLYKIKTGLLNNHTHNLFLELSISYGLIVSILFFSVILYILIKSFDTIFSLKNKSSIIDKGWWAGGFIFFFSHLFDVLIFDIRINLAIWIILAGLRNSFSNLNENYLRNKSLEN